LRKADSFTLSDPAGSAQPRLGLWENSSVFP
jgi:hypothetical protein